MSILQSIPRQARFIPTENIFSAVFNVPTVGKYDFSNALNTDVEVVKLQANSVYFINALSVGGNIASEDFLSSISTTPKIFLKRKAKNDNIYQLPIPILRYFDNKEIAAFVHSDNSDDAILLSMTGVLNQISSTIGVLSVSLAISLSIYAIDENSFNEQFRNSNRPVRQF